MPKSERVNIRDIKVSTRLRHEALTVIQAAISRYSYKWVGRYYRPSYEQWEANFLRDSNPDREIEWWMRVTCVMRSLGVCSEPEVRRITEELITGTTNAKTQAALEEVERDAQPFVREAFQDAGILPRDENTQ